MISLESIVKDFAVCIKKVDSLRSQAINIRTKEPYLPGIGPHTEYKTVQMVVREMQSTFNERYQVRIQMSVPYPDTPRQKCDLCVGSPNGWDWAIEVKMLRILGDNGKPNDNILMHILSPYTSHRSALTDCDKLVSSHLGDNRSILIYGYEHDDWPLEKAIEAFEALANTKVQVGPRISAEFSGLIHPIHKHGKVFAWEIRDRQL